MPLELDPEEMRRLGYATVDRIVERWATPAGPVPVRGSGPPPLETFGPPPEEGADLAGLLDLFERDVLRGYGRCDHPRYLAFIPGSTLWPSSLADLIAAATNIQVVSWYESPGPTRLETAVIDWMKHWVGYPADSSGILVSGGSAANMTALACAREMRVGPMSDDLVLYVSDQGHSSLARAARILGFRPRQVRVLPSDRRLRMRPEALRTAIEVDRAAGRRPLLVAANAGTTNAGQVDPLPEIASVCREADLWLHVDGAYGAFAVLADAGREQLRGLEQADSITLDPHKWLLQPFEVGALLVRQRSALRRAFEIIPDYLADTQAAAEEINYSDMGMQLTRSARALKVWLSVRFFGLRAFREAIAQSIELAKRAERRIETSAQLELLSPASLGIVCFRRSVPGADEATLERVNRHLVKAFEESGEGFLSSTRLHGRYSLRICVLNYATGAGDVDAALEWFERADVDAASGEGTTYDRQADIRAGWPGGLGASADLFAGFELFRSIDRGRLERVAAAAAPRTLAAGQEIVRQWESGDDFFLLAAGAVEVFVSGKKVSALGPGDYFGELAALDWGASFRYSRSATVVATEETVVLTLPASVLAELMREFEDVDVQIRQAFAERLERA